MDLSYEDFERLLNWLHSDREKAAQEYERIQMLLVRRFQMLECSFPDWLADVTMERVAKRLTTEKIENWVGSKQEYFERVADNVRLEHLKRNPREIQMPEDFDVVSGQEDEDLESMAQRYVRTTDAGPRRQ